MLFELDGYYASDITAYESKAGLSKVPLQNVLVDGFNGVPVGRRGQRSGFVFRPRLRQGTNSQASISPTEY